jgi:hypothetical protein
MTNQPVQCVAMNTHPCDDHPCDHCYLCDVVGVCCTTVTPSQRVGLEAEHRTAPIDRLRAAILADLGRTPGFAELVRLEALQRQPKFPASPPRLLPAAPIASIPHDQQKEAIHVAVPRPIQ